MKKRYPTKLTNVLKQRFPNFNKVCLCYANNRLYGMDISPEAKDWLNQHYFAEYGIKRKELTSEEAKVVQTYVEHNFQTIKSLIIWMALHEKSVFTELPEQDGEMQGDLRGVQAFSGVASAAGEGTAETLPS